MTLQNHWKLEIDINYFDTYWGKVLNELLLFVEGNGRFFFSNSHREGWFLKTNSSLIDAIFHVMVFAFFSVCVESLGGMQ